MEQNRNILGFDREQYDSLATEHSKGYIFTWLIVGLIFNVFRGQFFGISSFFLVFPGIFVASFASMPIFLLQLKKNEIIIKTKSKSILLLITLLWVLEQIYPLVIPIVYLLLIDFIVIHIPMWFSPVL